jgi:hypothetical protein
MPNNVISEINPTGEVGGEYKLKDSVARGLFFESEDDYEEAVSQGLLNDLPDGTMIYTPSTGGGGGGGGSTTVVEELSDIEAMTVFNGEAAGAKAVKTLKQAFSDALTALKNTAIAQAVGATGSTFTAVINKLAEIVNNGDTSKTITAGTSNKTSSIPAGYTSGGTITVSPTPSQTKTVTPSRSAQTVSPDSGKLLSSVSVNAFPEASGTFGTITSNGTHDMGSTNNYRYVSVNVISGMGQMLSYHFGSTVAKNYWFYSSVFDVGNNITRNVACGLTMGHTGAGSASTITYVLQGSNDRSNWSNLWYASANRNRQSNIQVMTAANNVSYRYYRAGMYSTDNETMLIASFSFTG